MDFLPTLPVLALFTVSAITLTVTPGPDMTLFLGKAVGQGRSAGLMAFAGAITGLIGHTVLAAFGVSALLAASETAFNVLKVVGAAYLVWLAYQALRHGSGLSDDPRFARRQSLKSVFAAGLAINVLNPKIILFFVTFLPQFVSPADSAAAQKLLFLGAYFIALAIPICVAMILAADRISRFIRSSPWATRAVDYVFAGVMGGFAIKLLLTKAGST
ncbi:MAG: LysE family translocator [Pseudomonadota bacterium]